MPDERNDPSQNTQAFQAWASQPPGQPEVTGSKVPLMVGVGLAAVVLLAVVGWLLMG